MTSKIERSYRIAAADTDSTFGLMLALYDTLSGNLRRAATALRSQDIERRCSELSHAYLVIGQLESWIDHDTDRQLSESLTLFYAHLRAQMLQASLTQSAPALEALMALVVQVRTAWQQREADMQQGKVGLPEKSVYDRASQRSEDRRMAVSQTA